MRRIFSKQKIAKNVAEVFRYDYHESIDVCMSQSGGLYYSNGCPINLSQTKAKSDILLPGWDFGKGNKLTLPWKVCECVACLYEENYIVAYK